MSDQDDRELALTTLRTKMLAYVVDELARRAGDGSAPELSTRVTESIDAVVRKSISDAMTDERSKDADAIARQVIAALPQPDTRVVGLKRQPDPSEIGDASPGDDGVVPPPPSPPDPEEERKGIPALLAVPWALFVIAAAMAVAIAAIYIPRATERTDVQETNARLADLRLKLIDKNIVSLRQTRAIYIDNKVYKDANCAVDPDKKIPCVTADKIQKVIESLEKR